MNEHEMDNVITVEDKDVEVIDSDTGEIVKGGKGDGLVIGLGIATGAVIAGVLLFKKFAAKKYHEARYARAKAVVAEYENNGSGEEEEDEES